MLDRTVLTITSDQGLLRLLECHLGHREAEGCRMTVAPTVEVACHLLEPSRPPRLIVVHWGRAGQYEDLNHLLWTTTVLARRVPFVVVADSFRVGQATRLYRMGVSEYLSRSHHERQIGGVLEAYLPGRRLPVDHGANPGSDHHLRRLGSPARPSLAM